MPSVKTRELDPVDQRLLNAVQLDFPVASRPFAVLAEQLGSTEDDIVGRLGSLKDDHIIRQISMIFDSRALGYKSSLVATRGPDGRVDEVAAGLNEPPGGRHNYRP